MMKFRPMQDKKEGRLALYVGILFGLVLISRITLIVYHNADYGGLDMNVIYGIQRIIGGEPLYQNPSLPTYAVMQYAPLFYYVAAGLAKALGIHMGDVYAVYVSTRALALLCNLITVGLAACVIRTGGFRPRRVWTFALPLLLILTFEHYTRVDSMHLMFFAATVWLTMEYLRRGGLWKLALAALAAGCCIMSKQSGVLVVGIVSFYFLFVARRYAIGLVFPVLSLGFAALVGWLCIGNNWEGAYQNAYLGLKNGIGWDWLYTIFVSQFYYDLILCYVLGGIVVWAAFRGIRDEGYRFLATGAALSFLFAVITGLKIGSGNNYFTEFLFFCLCALPWLLRSELADCSLVRAGRRSLSIRLFALIAFFVLVSSKTMGLSSGIWVEHWIKNKKPKFERQQALHEWFAKQGMLRPGEYVYFGTRGFLDNLFIGYSLLPTKDVVTQVYRTDTATFNYTPLIQGLSRGAIRYVITPEEYHSINSKDEEIPFMHFDEDAFRLIESRDGFLIYQYSGAPPRP
jgi:hypothetical protein